MNQSFESFGFVTYPSMICEASMAASVARRLTRHIPALVPSSTRPELAWNLMSPLVCTPLPQVDDNHRV